MIFLLVDSISAKLLITHGELEADDFKVLEEASVNLDVLWDKADLSFISKISGVYCSCC
jgi:hypothetical protein